MPVLKVQLFSWQIFLVAATAGNAMSIISRTNQAIVGKTGQVWRLASYDHNYTPCNVYSRLRPRVARSLQF